MIVPYNPQFHDWKQKRNDEKIVFYDDKEKINYLSDKKKLKRSDVENAPGQCSVHATGLLSTVLAKFLMIF